NINGFVVELWDERLVRWIFKTYPETALNVQCQNPEQRTYFMNNLRYLTEAGFKVEWLWSKLEMKKHEAYLDRKKRDSCEARIVKLKLELKKLDGAMSGLKAELKNEEAKRASDKLAYLTEAGLNVEWLRPNLEVKKHEAYLDRKKRDAYEARMAYFERKKRDACEARIVELKQEVKKLELAKSGLKAELKIEKAKLNP
ncbi:unnamed protein product, partial [Brassica oleracea var. botrytis]